MRRLLVASLLTLFALAAPAAAQETHRHSGNMSHVAHLPYEARNGTIPNYGTDSHYQISGMDTWSAKTPRIDPRTGDFYVYGNDIARGMDVYKFTAAGTPSASQRTWLTPPRR